MTGDVSRQHAAALVDLRRYDEAERELARVLATAPDDEDALRLMTQAQHSAGRDTQALATVGHLLTLVPGDPEGLRWAAYIHSARDEHALASDAASTAVRMSPDEAESHMAVAEVGIRQPSVSPVALEAAQHAVRLAPWASATHITLGNVQRKLRNPKEARASYETALRIDPGSRAARNNLALIDLDRGRAGSSAREFTGLLRQNPQDSTASRNLRVTIAVAMRNIRFALIGPFIALLLVDTGVFGSDPGDLLTGRITAAVLALIIGVGYGAVVLRSGGPGLRRFVVDRLANDRLFLACAVVLAGAVALFAVAPVIDFQADGGSPFLYTFVVVGGNLLTRRWTRRAR